MILLRRKGEIIVATGSVVDKVPSSNNAAASCTNTPACLPNHFTFTAGNLPWRDSAPKMGKKLQPPMVHALSALSAFLLLLSLYINLAKLRKLIDLADRWPTLMRGRALSLGFAACW